MLTFIIVLIILFLILKNLKIIIIIGAGIGLMVVMLVVGSILFSFFNLSGDLILKVVLGVVFSLIFIAAAGGAILEKIGGTVMDLLKR